MPEDRHTFTAGNASATVLGRGAELCSYAVAGLEAIWQAGPVWPSYAPILFPIVGELAGGHLLVDGRSYPMRRHGFARQRPFEWVEQGDAGCTLALTDDADSRAIYPFAFRLEIAYTLDETGLVMTGIVRNTGDGVLPCSLGFHPAFNWPLTGVSKTGYRVELSAPEDGTIAQLDNAGLVARRVPNPLAQGRVAELSDGLFAYDALVFDPLRSSSARLVAPDGAAVEVAWEGAEQLGLWSKPGPFVCIEPWRGHADPAGFAGEFRDKPGLLLLEPGGSFSLRLTIALHPRQR